MHSSPPLCLPYLHRLLKWSLFGSLLLSTSSMAQNSERWFQVELSIFTNENFNPAAEYWDTSRVTTNLLPAARTLIEFSEALALADWTVLQSQQVPDSLSIDADDLQIPAVAPVPGPPVYRSDNPYKLPDMARDAFIRLPPTEHGFTDTNRTLERSPSHRLLFHAAWRQPVRQPARSAAIIVMGGQAVGEQQELQGSVRFRFNPNEDRVVVDADIRLMQPDFGNSATYTTYQLRQSRDMRSNEFHYLDHPALGIVVMVKPYDVPPPEVTAEVDINSSLQPEITPGN